MSLNTIKHENISIVLKRPRYPENIGAAARAMCNMGFSRLVVVEPEDPDMERILKTATHEAASIVEGMVIAESVEKAVENAEYVVGTTARLGKQRRKASSPATLTPHLLDLSMNNRIAVLFGPEDRGLENADIALCDALIHIPTFGFTSINLAQAVMVVCYELNITRGEIKSSTPKLAGKRELLEMFRAIEETFSDIAFVNPEKPDYYVNAFRDFFSRISPRSRDVVVMRSLLSKIRNYGGRMYSKGREEKNETGGK
jgi:tRNA/rRNA methyltransferase